MRQSTKTVSNESSLSDIDAGITDRRHTKRNKKKLGGRHTRIAEEHVKKYKQEVI